MSRAVYLHVGAPKTGTTYLQDRLTRNAATLAGHGVHFPSRSRFVDNDLFHFRAALDLLEQDWGGEPGHAEGAWDAMVRRVRRRSGTVIISHEILAPAPPAKVCKVMNDLADSEVHVVYSARDLGRQLPAAWQESVKQGRKWTFARFLDRVENGNPWFARAFDLPRVLGTWGANLPPERVHVVTVPHRAPATPPDLLWQRFCQAFDVDPAWAPLDSERANRSLGIAETQLVRRLNRRMGRAARREAPYDELVREFLAQGELADRGSPPVRLPPDRFDWAEAQAEQWIEWLEGSGVHVVGDVDDLRPRRPAPDVPWRNPDKVGAKMLLGASLDALEAMTREAGRRPDPGRRLPGRVRANVRRLRSR
jgi:hypothetical protein